MAEDPIVEEVHRTREKLLKQYGGSEGYARHLRELETALQGGVVQRQPRPAAKSAERSCSS